MRSKEDVLAIMVAEELANTGGTPASAFNYDYGKLYDCNCIDILHEIAEGIVNKECGLLPGHFNAILDTCNMGVVNAIINARYLHTLESILCSSVLSKIDQSSQTSYRKEILNGLDKS